jgi:hypothetical protein
MVRQVIPKDTADWLKKEIKYPTKLLDACPTYSTHIAPL